MRACAVEFLGGVLGARGVGVDHGDEIGLRQRAQNAGMLPAEGSGADDGDFSRHGFDQCDVVC